MEYILYINKQTEGVILNLGYSIPEKKKKTITTNK